TTIVESGLDIPSANTLIVERADELGLAQLYQIRGRVGRSRERAYAYLLYPSAAALSEEAGQRLPAPPAFARAGGAWAGHASAPTRICSTRRRRRSPRRQASGSRRSRITPSSARASRSR